MPQQTNYTIFPLGDAAVTIDFGNTIDEAINKHVLSLFHLLKTNFMPGIIELVPAYSSLTIYYDMLTVKKNNPQHSSAHDAMKEKIAEKLQEPIEEQASLSLLIKVPVCYDKVFAPDTDELIATKNITVDELIRLHTSKTYSVYMLGFLPGFTYMGKLDDEIAMPRKINPRQHVEAGSVGIAGHQTGIYPLPSPGGWQIIGRTPMKLFDANRDELTPLKPGDQVQFYSISKDEFNSY
jgi:inhibitor of KinA